MTWSEPTGLGESRALVRYWLHHRESEDPIEFREEVGMALFLEKRVFQMMHPPERK